MTSEPMQRNPVEQLAESFLERYRRGERPAISEYTQRHPDLANDIRELFPALVLIEEVGPRQSQPPGACRGEVTADGQALERLGDYRILREIGRGGMGVVFEAVQESLGRHVALKVLPFHGLSNRNHLERFDREARSAARLHHTNIVPVYGIGVHAGVHYYAMQYIHGQGLEAVLEEVKRLRSGSDPAGGQPMTVSLAQSLIAEGADPAARADPGKGAADKELVPPERTPHPQVPLGSRDLTSRGTEQMSDLTGGSEGRYFRGVARIGVQVAEALAYAHRQGIVHRDIKPSNLLLDTQGVVWVTDFGLVKDEGGENLTTPGDIVGTIRYMAPERFQGCGDARSDVYSLGTTLYELITLRPSFEGSDRARVMERVLREEPPRPRKLDPRIPRDLETVVLKAMAKEPARRYHTAGDLAEDLRRFLADRPVQARRSSLAERTWRWCRRNPTVAILAAFISLLLVVIAAGALVSSFRLGKELERAERAEHNTARQLARAERAEADKTDKLWDSYLAHAQASRWSGRVGRRFAGLDAVRRAAAIRPDLLLRNEAIALFALPDMRIVQELPNAFPVGTTALICDPAFERYARSDGQGNLSVRWLKDDREIAFLAGFGGHAYFLKFSPDSKFLAALYHQGGELCIWDVGLSKVIFQSPNYGNVDFSPDSRLAAIDQNDGWIHLHDLVAGGEAKRLPISSGGHVCAFHPDGRTLAVGGRAPVQLFDLATGQVTRTLPQQGWPLWSANGSLLSLMNADAISTWDTRTWTQQAVLSTPDSHTDVMSFNQRGDLLASEGWDDILRLWDPRTGQQLLSHHGANSAQFSRDGHLLGSTRDGSKLQIWGVTGNRECRTLFTSRRPNQDTWDAHFSPDGRLLACACSDGVHLWDVIADRDVATLPAGECGGAVFCPDGSIVSNGGSLLHWPVRSQPAAGAGERRIGPPRRLVNRTPSGHHGGVCLCPDGKIAASIRNAQGHVIVVDPKNPVLEAAIPGNSNTTNRVAVSPDGRWVAAMTHFDLPSDKLRVSDLQTRQVVWTYPVATPGTFSPDGQWLVTGGDECRLWKVGTWELDQVIPRAAGLGKTFYAVFSPDGSVLAIAYASGVVRLVDPHSGQELATLAAPHGPQCVIKLCFSFDGSLLAGVIPRHGVHLWDLRLIRQQLADLGLDWNMPPYPPAEAGSPSRPLKVQVEAPAPIAPNNPPVVVSRKTLHARLALWSLASALAPYHPEPYHVRGHVYEQLGLAQQASADFTAALRWQPNDPKRLSHLYTSRGCNQARLKRYDGAVQDLHRALEYDPENRAACNNLAWLYVAGPEQRRDCQQALSLASRAVAGPSAPWQYLNTLGIAHYRLGDVRRAVTVLERSLRESNGAGAACNLFFLAQCHWRLGEPAQARDCYDRAVQWIHDRQATLSPEAREELDQFRAEAEVTLAKPGS